MSNLPSSGPPASQHAHPSLPAKPPTPASGTAFNPSTFGNGVPARNQSLNLYSRNVASPIGGGSSNSPGWNNSRSNYGNWSQPSMQQYSEPTYQQQSMYPTPFSHSPPQIHNPYAPPGAASQPNAPPRDPEYEAQIAQWQSAYTPKEESGGAVARSSNFGAQPTNKFTSEAGNLGGSSETGTTKPPSSENGKPSGKRITVIRSGGGETWEDQKLLDWDPAHFRLFIGNLAGEVTDDSLYKAFSKYGSIQKARVVRDGRTTKSKGYGFVSFSHGDDYFLAFREMDGKYIGSHPVQIKPAKNLIKSTAVKEDYKANVPAKKGREGRRARYQANYQAMKAADKTTNGSGSGAKGGTTGKNGSEAGGRANTGAGVQKPKKGSLKVLA